MAYRLACQVPLIVTACTGLGCQPDRRDTRCPTTRRESTTTCRVRVDRVSSIAIEVFTTVDPLRCIGFDAVAADGSPSASAEDTRSSGCTSGPQLVAGARPPP